MMQKIKFIFFFFFISIVCFAQPSGKPSFQKRQSNLQLGYGIGNIWKTFLKDAIDGSIPGITYKVTAVGPVALIYEYGISDRISIGAVVSYSIVQGKYSGFGETFVDELRIFTSLARANYHFGKSPKFDPYVGGGIGYVRSKYVNDQSASRNDVPGEFGYSAQLGCKYAFSKAFGAFGEIGYLNGSFVLLGVNFKW